MSQQPKPPTAWKLRGQALAQMGLPFYIFFEEPSAVYVPCLDEFFGVIAANDEPGNRKA